MIAKLDIMVEGGSGDEQYKNLFHSIMMNFCEKHAIMREQVGIVILYKRNLKLLVYLYLVLKCV